MGVAARKQPKEVPVSFKLESDLVKEIDKISERECRSRTGTVRLALTAFIESQRRDATSEKAKGARDGR